MENEEQKKDEGWRILLEAIEKSNQQVFDLRQSQIELLQKLYDADKKIQILTKMVAKLKYPKKSNADKSMCGFRKED